MRNVKAGFVYFAMVFGVGFVLGAIRVPLLVPRLGERVAELLEMPLMLVVVVLAARFIVRRFALPPTLQARLISGAVALALLLGAEFLLAVTLQGRSVGQYLASRDPVSGSVYLVLLVLFAVMPLLLARQRSRGGD